MQAKAQQEGLWNLFLPVESDPDRKYGGGLTNVEYAHICELMGKYPMSPVVCLLSVCMRFCCLVS